MWSWWKCPRWFLASRSCHREWCVFWAVTRGPWHCRAPTHTWSGQAEGNVTRDKCACLSYLPLTTYLLNVTSVWMFIVCVCQASVNWCRRARGTGVYCQSARGSEAARNVHTAHYSHTLASRPHWRSAGYTLKLSHRSTIIFLCTGFDICALIMWICALKSLFT